MAAIAGLLLTVSCYWGARERQREEELRASRAAEAAEAASLAAEALPVLTEEYRSLLDQISRAMETEELEKAAVLLTENQELLSSLFYETLEGERFLYRDQELQEELQGEGLVLTRPSRVFWGSFAEGVPEGSCRALQAVELDAPRYDYALGTWKDGKLHGKGETGYIYYAERPEGEAAGIRRKGTFAEDLMEGPVVYESISGHERASMVETPGPEEEITVWHLEAEGGITVLDERWTLLEDTGEYQLMSEDNAGHAYVLDEERLSRPVWKNPLIWEE